MRLSNLNQALQHRLTPLSVGDTPMLEGPALEFFQEQIQHSKTYLEFGSGASTVYAAGHVNALVSVESDKRFLNLVEARIAATGHTDKCHLLHADIGLIRAFGKPVFVKPSKRRLDLWRDYPLRPWDTLKSHRLYPDLIMIDGRFRVACALATLLNHPDPAIVQVLFDDYGRDEYRMTEAFFSVERMAGRLAVLRAKPDALADTPSAGRLFEESLKYYM